MHVQGDSGSPVFCAAPGGSSYQMMGVVSWGFGHCAARPAVPDVSTFVPPYVTWIDGARNSLSTCSQPNLLSLIHISEPTRPP